MYQYFYNCIPREPNQSNCFPQNCLSFSYSERYPFVTANNGMRDGCVVSASCSRYWCSCRYYSWPMIDNAEVEIRGRRTDVSLMHSLSVWLETVCFCIVNICLWFMATLIGCVLRGKMNSRLAMCANGVLCDHIESWRETQECEDLWLLLRNVTNAGSILSKENECPLEGTCYIEVLLMKNWCGSGKEA